MDGPPITGLDPPRARLATGDGGGAPGGSVAALSDTADTVPVAGPPAALEQRPVVYVVGLLRRMQAALLDATIVVPFAIFVALVAARIANVAVPVPRHGGLDFWIDQTVAGDAAVGGVIGVMLAVTTLYAFFFHAGMGCTPGMRLLGLRVIDSYGRAPSPIRAAARIVGTIASAMTFGLGFLWIGFDRDKRGLHDWIAGTYVVWADPHPTPVVCLHCAVSFRGVRNRTALGFPQYTCDGCRARSVYPLDSNDYYATWAWLGLLLVAIAAAAFVARPAALFLLPSLPYLVCKLACQRRRARVVAGAVASALASKSAGLA